MPDSDIHPSGRLLSVGTDIFFVVVKVARILASVTVPDAFSLLTVYPWEEASVYVIS